MVRLHVAALRAGWDGFVLQALTSSLPAPSTGTTTLAPPILIQIVPVN